MTAINVFVESGRVVLVTDSAGIDAAGRVVGFTTKTFALPHLNCAVGANGTTLLVQLAVESALAAGATCEEMRANFTMRLKEKFDRVRAIAGDSVVAGVVVLAGVAAAGPFAELVPTCDALPWPAFKATKIEAAFLTPTTAELNDEFGDLADGYDAPRAIELLRRQRSVIAPSLGNWTTPIVGGAIVETIITREQITSRIVAKFDDKIGEVIAA